MGRRCVRHSVDCEVYQPLTGSCKIEQATRLIKSSPRRLNTDCGGRTSVIDSELSVGGQSMMNNKDSFVVGAL